MHWVSESPLCRQEVPAASQCISCLSGVDEPWPEHLELRGHTPVASDLGSCLQRTRGCSPDCGSVPESKALSEVHGRGHSHAASHDLWSCHMCTLPTREKQVNSPHNFHSSPLNFGLLSSRISRDPPPLRASLQTPSEYHCCQFMSC